MMRPTCACLAVLLAVACQNSAPDSPDAGSASAPAVLEPASPAEPAVDDQLAQARELLAAGDPYQALVVLDEVQRTAPDHAGAWNLRGQAAMAAAERGQSATDFYIDAQKAFERAAELDGDPASLLGASRAARMSLDNPRALELAREGLAAYEAASPRPVLAPPAERTLIEALFAVYVERRQAGEDAAELFGETEERLSASTRANPSDTWAWTQLANLYQWEGQADQALAAQEQVLILSPDDSSVHERYGQLARASAGGAALLAGYERFAAAHPDHALYAWYVGVETFNQALADLHADRESIAGFQSAEALLRRCRELENGYEASCKGYEVMCRDGVAWALYGKGDLAGAQSAFLSMEEVFPGGLDWQIQGEKSLLSGVTGLQFVADKYVQRGKGEFDIEGKPEAAEIFDLLRELRPQDANFANNAGLFHRDCCVIRELQAQTALRLADGRKRVLRTPVEGDVERSSYEDVQVEVTPEEAATMRSDAVELRRLAGEHAQKSYEAYLAAAQLAPDDVRVQNDAALVMVYHIRRDVPQMEALLRRAMELGERQVQDPALSAEDLDLLLEAWGDAYQNMGLVHLTLKNDPAGARAFFEKSFEIGPRPRVDRTWIEERALPACDKALAGDPEALADLDPRLWLHIQP